MASRPLRKRSYPKKTWWNPHLTYPHSYCATWVLLLRRLSPAGILLQQARSLLILSDDRYQSVDHPPPHFDPNTFKESRSTLHHQINSIIPEHGQCYLRQIWFHELQIQTTCMQATRCPATENQSIKRILMRSCAILHQWIVSMMIKTRIVSWHVSLFPTCVS